MSHLTYPHEVAAGEALRLRLADVDDAARISGWTSAPEVRRHWNAGQPVPVEESLEKYTGRRAPDVVSYVVCEHDEPVGYVQAWQAAGFVPTGEVGTDDGVATRMMSFPGVIREPRPT